jgi:putative ATPase
MRPKALDELIGQEKVVGPGRLLRRMIEADRLSSIILWGPAGSGKTSLARVVAETTESEFVELSAVTSGVADVRRVIEEAGDRLGQHGRRTILFIDELHRFNKVQQDALLPHVEKGIITLIGATTENPYFEVIAPLVSRCRVFRLEPLDSAALATIVLRALADRERGLGNYRVELTPEALAHLVETANGDARTLLNAVELAVLTTPPDPDGVRRITLPIAEESIQRRALTYDKTGDQHYDTISAFIKSLRGSDPDAALYWLARMLYAGEDPTFIARRMVILASEDVGNADPMALVLATATFQAVESIGMPEARIPLAQAATYLASAPKSNAAYLGVDEALRDVADKTIHSGVPRHLRNPVAKGLADMGHGQGYRYPHDFAGHFTPQEYLPTELRGKLYYRPSDEGREKELKERLERQWPERRRTPNGTAGDRPGR